MCSISSNRILNHPQSSATGSPVRRSASCKSCVLKAFAQTMPRHLAAEELEGWMLHTGEMKIFVSEVAGWQVGRNTHNLNGKWNVVNENGCFGTHLLIVDDFSNWRGTLFQLWGHLSWGKTQMFVEAHVTIYTRCQL